MATKVEVYPRPGETYPDAAGVTITSAGAIVWSSKYVEDAIRDGFLLTYDPYGVGIPDDRTDTLPPAEGAPSNAPYVLTSSTPELPDARVLTAGTGISVAVGGPGGAVVVSATGVAPPVDAEYLVAASHGTLTAERVLTAGAGIALTPTAGALAVSSTVVAPAAPAAAPPPVAASSSLGTPGTYATAQHTHGHGDHPGGSLHALATTTVPGFVSGAEKVKIAAIPAAGAAPADADYIVGTASAGLSAERVLTAGAGITITPGAGTMTVSATGGGGGGAPTDAEYLVSATHAGLSAERVLTAGAGITLTPAAGTLTIASTGGGGGGVQGPATATDNAVTRWDGTTGALVQNSLVTIDDAGNIATPGTVDGMDVSELGLGLALLAVPSYVTLAATPTLGNERVLTGGTGITVTDGGAGGAVTIASTVAGGAPTDAEYLVAATHAGLSAERVLTAGTGVTVTPTAGVLTVATPNAVQGPASTNDNRLVRWDGTTGKLVQDSFATLDDAGTLTTPGLIISGNIALSGTVDGVDVGDLGAVPFVTIGASAAVANERALTAGAGISITDGGAGGAVTVASTVTAGAPTDAEYLVSAASGGLSAERVLTAGANITLTPGAGTLTVASTAGGGGAPTTAQYLTLAADATLTNERVLTAGAGISFVDGGAGGTLTVARSSSTNSQTGPYTLVLADAGKTVQIYSPTPAALTIPAEASVYFPVGTEIYVLQTHTGSVSIALDAGVQLLTDTHQIMSGPLANAVSLSGLHTTVRLLKLSSNQWIVNGDLALYVGVVTASTYTLVSADIDNLVTTTNASAVTITIPLSSMAAPLGCRISIFQQGAGQVTVAPAASVTLNVPGGFVAKTRGQYSQVTLTKVAADTWDIAGDLEGAAPFALNNQTGTAYTLVLADAPKCVTMNNAAANTLTIPANASVAFPIGTVITVMQLGVGQTTIAITTDTLNNPALTAKLRARYSVASITKITATSWVLSGDLAAS